MNRRISVRGIVMHEGKLLCVRLRPTFAAPQNNTFWCTPGGGLDPGESIEDGLVREFIEETGIRPEIGNLLYVQQYKDEHGEYLEFFFAVTNVDDYLHIDLQSTTHGMQEIQDVEFVEASTVRVLPAFLSERDLDEDVRTGTAHCFTYL